MKGNLTLLGALVLVGLAACSAYGPGSMMHGYGMGPGMTPGIGRSLGAASSTTMLGLGHLPASLSAGQRAQVEEIARDLQRRQSALMQRMHGSTAAGEPAVPFDEEAARKDFDGVAGLHREMLENTIAARKRIDAVLTAEQRDEWRRGHAPR